MSIHVLYVLTFWAEAAESEAVAAAAAKDQDYGQYAGKASREAAAFASAYGRVDAPEAVAAEAA